MDGVILTCTTRPAAVYRGDRRNPDCKRSAGVGCLLFRFSFVPHRYPVTAAFMIFLRREHQLGLGQFSSILYPNSEGVYCIAPVLFAFVSATHSLCLPFVYSILFRRPRPSDGFSQPRNHSCRWIIRRLGRPLLVAVSSAC